MPTHMISFEKTNKNVQKWNQILHETIHNNIEHSIGQVTNSDICESSRYKLQLQE